MAKKKYDPVFQFKITLKGIKPPIWRQIQVQEIYTFWDLHVAIQDAMGWDDYHLHEFEVVNPSTGLGVIIGSPTPHEVLAGEDPEHFDVKEISFDNPDKRHKSAFGEMLE
ncbi:plasmid pRiA4b ORF-3 family protein [Methanophagales archaeon]|nr:MAG: plasmid pRiA4b ORF-3 family protein [Methanophagales archaeon]